MQVTVKSREDAEGLLRVPGAVDAVISIHTPTNSTFSHYHPALGKPCEGFASFRGPKLALAFDDITIPRVGYTMVSQAHIMQVIGWGKRLWEETTVLVHCTQGVARSPAIAFVLLTSRLGPGSEEEAQKMVIANSGPIRPNMAVIQAADSYLKRGGAMVKVWEDWEEARRGIVVLT